MSNGIVIKFHFHNFIASDKTKVVLKLTISKRFEPLIKQPINTFS